MVTIRANGVSLPSPTEVSTTDEVIWSSNTGRSTSGKMIGDVVAEKQTFEIKWGVITEAEFQLIRRNIRSGFHPFTLTIDGTDTTITSYRGNIVSPILGTFAGVTYRKEASVTIIQQ